MREIVDRVVAPVEAVDRRDASPPPLTANRRAFGVLVRNAGDVLVLAPAFVAEEVHIAQMVDTLGEAIRAFA